MKPKVLVACEYSGTVRDAFASIGWEAWSCDLLPSETPGRHIQGDVSELLSERWDLIVAHPPCTYLCASGMHWTARGLRDPQLTEDAVAFVKQILESPCKHIAVENPVGILSTRIRKPDGYIQPWQFGHPESKKTGLWLKELPMLRSTEVLPKPAPGVWENQTPSGQNKLSRTKDRWAKRSRTYPGIAKAMAEQWGAHVLQSKGAGK